MSVLVSDSIENWREYERTEKFLRLFWRKINEKTLLRLSDVRRETVGRRDIFRRSRVFRGCFYLRRVLEITAEN